MKRAWLVLCVLLAMLAHPLAGWARDDEFTVEAMPFHLEDVDGRPYDCGPGEANLVVRLLSVEENPNLEGYSEIRAEDTVYAMDGAGLPFQVRGDLATARFVVFRDTARNPVRYGLFLQKHGKNGADREVTLLKSVHEAGPVDEEAEGPPATVTLATTERASRAWEYATLAGMGVVGLLFAWLLLGHSLFRRMLFQGRLAVSTALVFSNLLLLGAVILLGVCLILGCLFPGVTGGYFPYWGYCAAGGGFLALVGLIWLFGRLAWR